MSEVENQIYEIIAIEHDDYKDRMMAIDNITDFETLEGIFVADEYITVRMKAFDRLTELFFNDKKYKKMMKVWKNVGDFTGWIHFIINELGRGNNIEKTVRYILEGYGYPFDDFWNRWHVSRTRNHIFQNVVDVMLLPIRSNECYSQYGNRYYCQDGLQIRYTDYGIQYHYEMVIKILKENEQNGLFHEYIYIRCWNTHPNANEKFYKKLNYEVKK